ncbi:MAG: CRISPR-associated endonuclease Cas1 [Gammaproteobacteria bacterium]|nr:CRISPR-associated endonuclease Cas1 [Gammaproteobacteria bacterium]
MKHLVICDYGVFLGLDNHRLAIKQGGETQFYPLNRLRTVTISKRGISISSNVIQAFSSRGIKLFFLDFRGVVHAAIVSQSQHGVVAVRMAQIKFCKGDTMPLSRNIVIAKIKNQRAVLNYLYKYHRHPSLYSSAEKLLVNAGRIRQAKNIDTILGFEGASASTYFQSLREAELLTSSFKKREGRGSQEINNAMLNLGYAVLSNYILNAIINAGLEPYVGILHSQRPGKMSLVLDLMEEYRAWVVDRTVIKLRSRSKGQESLDSDLKKLLITEVQQTCAKKYPYRKKKLRLEHIIQRQVYRLCGHFYGENIYKPYLFKW